MVTFDEIRGSLRLGHFWVSEHAYDELADDDLTVEQVVLATVSAASEVVENYPKAKPNPSCLVLGHLAEGDAVHVVWAMDAASGYTSMVTAYRPDATRWSDDFRKRVKP